jgi:hypothetical protein
MRVLVFQTRHLKASFAPLYPYHSSSYQAWLSTNGLDVTSVSAHRATIQAEADVQAIKRLIASGDLYDDEKMMTFFAQLKQNSDEEPRPLPDNLVRLITRSIMCAVVDRSQQVRL